MGTQGIVGQDLFQTKNSCVRKTGGKTAGSKTKQNTKVQILQNETGSEADRWKFTYRLVVNTVLMDKTL